MSPILASVICGMLAGVWVSMLFIHITIDKIRIILEKLLEEFKGAKNESIGID